VPSGSTVVVACSGGPDSLALVAATVHEARAGGWRVVGATVDHGMQDGSEAQTARVVEQMAEIGVDETLAARVTVDPGGLGPEAAARRARYAVLEQVAEHTAASVVLLGHTRDDQAETVHLRTRDPHQALQALRERDRQHVFLEGGPTLAAAFLREGLVDEVVAYVAPFLLGAGQQAVADLGITTIADAWRPRVVDLTVLEPVVDGEEQNVRLTLEPHREDH